MSAPDISTPAAVIEMTGVTVGSIQDSSVPVLENVKWSVASGEYWVIAGMHGSGRSALLALAAGLVAPIAGECRLFEKPLVFGDDSLLPERLRLGLVFQDGQLFHRLTVAENIALPLQYHRELSQAEISSEVERILERTDLARYAAAPAGTLGRNWQKRAGLARALALDPELLLLDDPLGGLDLRHIQWWLKFLSELSSQRQKEGSPRTFVITTGDLRPWRERATHFAMLQQGHLTCLGQRDALARQQDPIVNEFLGVTGS